MALKFVGLETKIIDFGTKIINRLGQIGACAFGMPLEGDCGKRAGIAVLIRVVGITLFRVWHLTVRPPVQYLQSVFISPSSS